MTPAPTKIIPLLFVALIVWRVLTRVRRSVGRQPVRTTRLVTRIVIYSVLCVFLGFVAMNHPKVLAALGGGLVVGIPIALIGLRLTRYETTPAGRFYTPNAYIGVTISLIFIGRLFYRLSTVYTTASQLQSSSQSPQHPQLMQSPLTYFFFGILAGYYIAYFAGILIACNKPVVGQPSSVA